MKKCKLLAWAITGVVFTSCSVGSHVSNGSLIQKRKYNTGFASFKSHTDRSGELNQTASISDDYFIDAVSDDNYEVEVHEVIESPYSTYVVPEQNQEVSPEQSFELPIASKTEDGITTTLIPQERLMAKEDGGGSGAMRTIGWVLIGLGLLILLFLSILIGALLALLGLIFVLAGGVGGNQKKEDTGVLQEVVYLKNGSIIRGTIMEQVPGVSLKIQTADGSVFVYSMDEVEKITKEPKK